MPLSTEHPDAEHRPAGPSEDSAEFLRARRQTVEIASYDECLLEGARRIGLAISRHCL